MVKAWSPFDGHSFMNYAQVPSLESCLINLVHVTILVDDDVLLGYGLGYISCRMLQKLLQRAPAVEDAFRNAWVEIFTVDDLNRALKSNFTFAKLLCICI